MLKGIKELYLDAKNISGNINIHKEIVVVIMQFMILIMMEQKI